MASKFLARLPKVGRGILSKEDQHCSICLEEYGTTPSPNGIIQRAVINAATTPAPSISLSERIAVLGHRLSLPTVVITLVVSIADRVHHFGSLGGHSVVAVAAGSLYMASQVMDRPISLQALSRGLAEAGMGDVRIGVIQSAYEWLYR
ncbi:hypothetical protein HO173_011098 [Letharia columbiana]|uniref:Uncharacterized protein n=1 Tax=Letharia columbiana TaxID=112416 RepID=A0A8H6FL58_9LECA|nr:uncharacterized protein HO173_011098 [Letharia columbiana]KAF6230561.1 hypothetical protein HO173_011098 [Letharia columbiana]